MNVALADLDADVSAAPYNLNKGIATACAQAGVSYFDLTEDVETTNFIRDLAKKSPKVTFNIAGNYTYPLQSGAAIVTSADAAYSSKIYFDNSNADRLSQDGVWIAGAQAAWRSPDTSIEAGLFARNIFNKDYVVSISNIDSLGEDLLAYNRPRSLGIFLRYHY